MNWFPILLLCAAVFALYFALFGHRKRHAPADLVMPENYARILAENVSFYRHLSPEHRHEFGQRMLRFLSATRIIGVTTEVTDRDKVYIAASAVIPIFGLGDWDYPNLDEVLLYPDAFDHDFRQTGDERSILGIVGEGALQRVMVLSQRELHRAFEQQNAKENTAIHEFVHLIDKADGSTDGVPSFFIGHEYVKPWLQLIHREIRRILDNHSDINPYGTTNEAEFFAVVSEYFFSAPGLFAQKHPELYNLLVQAFHQQPATQQPPAVITQSTDI